MASNQEIENGKNRVQEDMRAPLIQREVISANSNEKKSLKGSGKEERCMVYLTTFVAVCGSYAFGSCVCSPFVRNLLARSVVKKSFLDDLLLCRQGIRRLLRLQSEKMCTYH